MCDANEVAQRTDAGYLIFFYKYLPENSPNKSLSTFASENGKIKFCRSNKSFL
jgi:hypothetical protein